MGSEGLHAFDVQAMLDLFHPEVVFKNVNATINGIEEFRMMAEQFKALFAVSPSVDHPS